MTRGGREAAPHLNLLPWGEEARRGWTGYSSAMVTPSAAVAGLGVVEHAHEGMPVEGVVDDVAQDAATLPVDDPHAAVLGQHRLLDIFVDGFDGLLRAHPMDPELVADARPALHPLVHGVADARRRLWPGDLALDAVQRDFDPHRSRLHVEAAVAPGAEHLGHGFETPHADEVAGLEALGGGGRAGIFPRPRPQRLPHFVDLSREPGEFVAALFVHQRVDAPPGVAQAALHLLGHHLRLDALFEQGLAVLRLQRLGPLLHGGPLRLDRAPFGLGAGALLLRLGVTPLDVFEQHLDLGGALPHRVSGDFEHFGRQAEAFGYGEGVAPAGHADNEPEGRRQRDRIELNVGVLHAAGHVGETLDLAVVRGHDGDGAPLGERREDGLAEGGALLRIGARADFIEQDERAPRRRAEDIDDRPHVGAERRERLLDALLIADVGVDAVERLECRAARGGDGQAGLRHQREKPDGLEGDGLPAGVRPRDDERAERFADLQRHGDGVVAEQRVARVDQAHRFLAVVVEGRGDRAVHLPPEARLGERQVQGRQPLDASSDCLFPLAEHGGQTA